MYKNYKPWEFNDWKGNENAGANKTKDSRKLRENWVRSQIIRAAYKSSSIDDDD
jgi:hypothetical protein